MQRPGDTDDINKPEMRRIVNSALYSDTDEDAGSVTDVRVCSIFVITCPLLLCLASIILHRPGDLV